MIPMALGEVAAAIGAASAGHRFQTGATVDRLLVRRVTTDSREVEPGDLFIAIRGERFDGHQFIPEAVSKGAVACVCDRGWLGAGRTFQSVGPTFQSVERQARKPVPQVSRGLKPAAQSAPCLVVADTVEALGQLAAHYRHNVVRAAVRHWRVIAVTGSNGKTTAKCMIDHVLRESFKGRAAPKNFNNRIGVPLTLLSADADDRYLIVEIGTNAPGEVASLGAMASPDAAVITSIGEAHLEGLGSIDGVAAEKASLLDHVWPSGLAVVNIDRPEINKYLWDRSLRGQLSSHPDDRLSSASHGIDENACPRRARLVTFGVDSRAKLRVADAHGDVRSTRFELDGRYRVELPMPGIHHATNAAAAFAVARWFGIAPEEIIERLRSFTPPEGRMRLHEIGGLVVVDDAYNANPASMAAAVEMLRRVRPERGRRVCVMGDMLELGPESASFHRRAVRAVLEAGIEILVAVGPATTEAIQSVGHRFETDATCDDALRLAFQSVEPIFQSVGPTFQSVERQAGKPVPQTQAGKPVPQTQAGKPVPQTQAGKPVPQTWAGKPFSQQVILCMDANAASDALVTILAAGDTVLVKGSRAMGLDRVVRALRACFAQPAAVA